MNSEPPFGGLFYENEIQLTGGVYRGTGIGGEAVFQTGKALKANILNFVARLTESEASLLDVRNGNVVDKQSGAVKMTLEEVARTAYFRTEQVPKDYQPELTVTRSYAQKHYSGIFTNGAHASYVEVDPETGFVKVLKHWVIDDAGTVVNPLLVDEQIRGGVVQGMAQALYEEAVYDVDGNDEQVLEVARFDLLDQPRARLRHDLDGAGVLLEQRGEARARSSPGSPAYRYARCRAAPAHRRLHS